MLYEVMKECRNYFLTGVRQDGDFTVTTDGMVSLPFLKTGDYVLIEGAGVIDGVYQLPDTDLGAGSYNGSVAVCAPNSAFLRLVSEIDTYVQKNGERSPYTSESFGGYSYSRAAGAGVSADWQDVFRQRLNMWRKL